MLRSAPELVSLAVVPLSALSRLSSCFLTPPRFCAPCVYHTHYLIVLPPSPHLTATGWFRWRAVPRASGMYFSH